MFSGEQGSLKYKVYRQLREEIVFGRLSPGEPVREALWAQKFQCSRGPVREALNQLERQGFLQLTPNQGAVVMKTSPEDVRDYYGLLELLESKAVEWAIPFLTPQDIDRLVAINDAMKSIPRGGKGFTESWMPLNLEFHGLFRRRCSNTKMNWIVEDIRMRVTRYRYTSLVVTAIDEYLRDHERIIEAARKGDGVEGGRSMATHICRAKDVLMEFFSRLPVP